MYVSLVGKNYAALEFIQVSNRLFCILHLHNNYIFILKQDGEAAEARQPYQGTDAGGTHRGARPGHLAQVLHCEILVCRKEVYMYYII